MEVDNIEGSCGGWVISLIEEGEGSGDELVVELYGDLGFC